MKVNLCFFFTFLKFKRILGEKKDFLLFRVEELIFAIKEDEDIAYDGLFQFFLKFKKN